MGTQNRMVRSPDEPGAMGGGGGVRPTSLQLRQQASGAGQAGTLMDPANQSLADALRVTFRLLQFAMVVLALLFALSGFQSIKEGEQGIRLLFGKVAGNNLPPGFRFSFPYPFGELVKVPMSGPQLEIDEAFWPALQPADRGKSAEQLAKLGNFTLSPGRDGSLLTADGSIAHTRWKLTYRRDDPARVVQNIYTEDEEKIVRAAVQRGVVQAVARTTIDSLLKQSSDDTGSVAMRAKDLAQRMLDGLRSGIKIEQLTLVQTMAPLKLYQDFSKVQAAVSNAAKIQAEAEAEGRQRRNAVAGAAAELLVDQIGRYERAVELGETEAQRTTLATIDALLEGRPVEIDGRAVGDVVSGEVTQLLSEARLYSSSVVTRSQSDLNLFEAKLEQFRANPLVVVHRDWTEALGEFMGRDFVSAMWLPSGTGVLELLINADPDILKDQQKAAKLRSNLRSVEERFEQQRRDRFKTNTEAPADAS